MRQKDIDKRFHLDAEIRELIQFAHSMYGEKGVEYTRAQVNSIVDGLNSKELEQPIIEKGEE